MSEITLTVKQIFDLGLWSKVCEYKDWDEWILNDGKIDDDTLVTFDSEFKKEEVKTTEELIREFYLESLDNVNSYDRDEVLENNGKLDAIRYVLNLLNRMDIIE